MRKKNSYILLGVLLFIAGAIAISYTAEHKKIETVSSTLVRVGYREHNLYTPTFVAKEKKFFEEKNLRAELVKFESTNQLTDALLAGNIDAALGGVNIPLVFNIESKSPGEIKLFTVVQETAAVPASYLLVKKDSPISSVSNLRGKKIGAYSGSTVQVLYRQMIQADFEPGEATFIQMKPELELAALESGQVDAVIVLEPLGTIALEKGIAKAIKKSLFHEYLQANLPLAASVISTKFSSAHPKEAVALSDIAKKSIDFINSNPIETKNILLKYTPLEQNVIDKMPLPRFYSLVDQNQLQRLADTLLAENDLSSPIDVQNLLFK